MSMHRLASHLTIATLVAACYNPSGADEDYTEGLEHTGSGSGNDGASDAGPTTDEPTAGSAPTSVADDTTAMGVCGDGTVEGDEVCDDGVNDGSYGGCVADCSAFAERCGDAAINGAEVCDDGVNDGGYGGCAADCTALGPFCGDGTMQDAEACDAGAGNANGTGCNLDCTISASTLGTFMRDGLDYCDGVFVTPPAFRASGNADIAVTGYCPGDTHTFLEFTSALEIADEFDLLLPTRPVREATMVADTWLMTSYGCDYLVDAAGTYTEVCDDTRVAGTEAVDGSASGEYVGLDYDRVGYYGAGSPMVGDAPVWMVQPTDDPYTDYAYYHVIFGASGSVAIGGQQTNIADGTSIGYVEVYTAAGNSITARAIPSSGPINQLLAMPDGTLVAVSEYPGFTVTGLDGDYQPVWSVAVPTQGNIDAALDASGALVLLYRDISSDTTTLTKYAAGSSTQLWTRTVDNPSYSPRVAIAPDDTIWVAGAYSLPPNYDQYHLVVEKIAP